MATNPLRLAIIGLGNQGQEHLAGMHSSQHCQFVAGVDASLEQQAKTQEHYPALQLFSTIEELAAAQQTLALDALVLCLPHHRYADIWPTVSALALPVLKEKPLARNLNEARQLRHKLGHSRLKTAIQRRHHPSYHFLKQLLTKENANIIEAHTWLHLGRKSGGDIKGDWRTDQAQSGGGILLDAGYHLVDLLHFYIGSFELVSCTLWRNEQRCAQGDIDDAAELIGRNEQSWITLDARLSGNKDAQGKVQKSEGITLLTNKGEYFANRTEVKKDGTIVWQGERDWQHAMGEQLDSFAHDIHTNRWHSSTYWDHIPAMKLIEAAYQKAQHL